MVLRFVPRVLAGLLVLLLGACAAPATDTAPSRAPATATTASRAPAAAATPSWAAGMATVGVSGLPAEARHTLDLIDRGGPFPYARDGIVFGNVEGRLPRHPRGYYHEYTVPTPGSRDRGARRLVTGRGGETYYTDDHYDSFRAVLR
ncbi:ribonuclease domain-containing protein [Streptomyces sp. NPDC057413]|uniref:ribonuclease domain-containing protein n=1 Tax=Streptomyces sp. NPDC057413 TaxID=3346124 RepID=UPI00369E4673